MKLVASILMALALVPLIACSPVETKARDTAAALSGSIVAAQFKYQASCQANPAQQVCVAINKGVNAENALVSAVETYCGWEVNAAPPDPNAKCVPVKSAEQALVAAIANAATITTEIKGVI